MGPSAMPIKLQLAALALLQPACTSALCRSRVTSGQRCVCPGLRAAHPAGAPEHMARAVHTAPSPILSCSCLGCDCQLRRCMEQALGMRAAWMGGHAARRAAPLMQRRACPGARPAAPLLADGVRWSLAVQSPSHRKGLRRRQTTSERCSWRQAAMSRRGVGVDYECVAPFKRARGANETVWPLACRGAPGIKLPQLVRGVQGGLSFMSCPAFAFSDWRVPLSRSSTAVILPAEPGLADMRASVVRSLACRLTAAGGDVGRLMVRREE